MKTTIRARRSKRKPMAGLLARPANRPRKVPSALRKARERIMRPKQRTTPE